MTNRRYVVFNFIIKVLNARKVVSVGNRAPKDHINGSIAAPVV